MAQRHHPGGGKRARAGKRSDLDNRYFRSAWEANYARYLNWLVKMGEIIKWDYEVDTFEFPVKRGSKFYTPDFKVWESDRVVYHEVKGWMDQQSMTKLRRMARHYPTLTVLVIDGRAYHSIAKKVAAMIPGWES